MTARAPGAVQYTGLLIYTASPDQCMEEEGEYLQSSARTGIHSHSIASARVHRSLGEGEGEGEGEVVKE